MNAGERVAHYEIIGPIGRGGMGEVYRARDTRLGREVALKVLPTDLQADPERLARFRREAKVLASLNHTNIAAIHGLEQEADRLVLAMELAPGETLEARAARGAMSAEAVLDVALQIAAGLEEAHQKGVVHRDLKPANVKLGPEGQVKILDFGLARALAGDESAVGDPDLSPTLTAAMTASGVILGTAAYMSPEQARGHGVDARTDIWAFGVILWELLAGRRLFAGETVSDTLAMVLRADPDWDALPADLPPSLRGLVRRCLQRDRRQRLHHIADARIVLEEIRRDGTSAHMGASGLGLPASPPARGAAQLAARAGWLAAGVLAVAVVALALRGGGEAPRPARAVRFDLVLPNELWFGGGRQQVAVAPGGEAIAMGLFDAKGRRLYVRRLDSPELAPIPGTEDGSTPSFSPDGKSLVFTQAGRLRRVPLDGGSPIDLCATEWGGGWWGDDGHIVFTRSYAGGLDRVPAHGGPVEQLTEPDPATGELGHWWPQVLPGGKWIVYTSWNTPIEKARIMAFSPASGEKRVLVEGGAFGRVLPTGHLAFVRDRKLMAVPFDAGAVAAGGAPETLLEDVYLNNNDGYANLSFGADGTLAYIPFSVLETPLELVWLDRDGAATPSGLRPGRYGAPRLSPDGRRLAVAVSEDGNSDVWLHEFARGIWTRFTFSASSDFNPVWSRDGRTVYYNGEEPQFTIYRRPADGSADATLLLKEPVDTNPTDVTPDGRYLVFTRSSVDTGSDICALPLDGSAPTRDVLKTDFTENLGCVSPDGRWLAYASNESGREQVYVTRFPDGGARAQISLEGGSAPNWSPQGDELFFLEGNQLMAAGVDLRAAAPDGVPVGRPRLLFPVSVDRDGYGPGYEPAADGRRFLVARRPDAARARTVRVVLDWFGQIASSSSSSR